MSNVDHPQHYGGADNPYEVIKVLEAWLTREEFVGGLKFNIHKYYARAALKAGAEDYAKGAWYASYLEGFLKRFPDNTRIARVDAAFAAKLRTSMELNAKLKRSIQDLSVNVRGKSADDIKASLLEILKSS